MMKNFLFTTLILFLLGNLCRFGLPWWTIVPMAAFVAWWFPQPGYSAFAAGLLGGALLWGGSAFLLNAANGGMFAAKVGQVFQGASAGKLLFGTALMGGLLGGFGALTGQWAKDLLAKPKRRDYYVPRGRSGKYR